MGNLIKDYWTFAYNEKNYYGIVEVVRGELQHRKVDGKFETRIEKAIQYMMKSGIKTLSHMSVQSYNTYLNKDGRTLRSADEETYYPFFLEFEPHKRPSDYGFEGEYKNAAAEAYRTLQYLVYELDVDPEDIMTMITNSRSIYLFVNPKAYELKPSRTLHNIYKGIYSELNEVLDLKYVDTNQFRANGLIKTPGAYYEGGYVVPVTMDELKKMVVNPGMKAEYTKKQRSIDKMVPGKVARGFKRLYNASLEQTNDTRKEKAQNGRKKNEKAQNENVTYLNADLSTDIKCVRRIENSMIEQGERNFALVSLAIAYKKAGYSEEQVTEIVQRAADRWGHDESSSQIRSKVRLVFKHDYGFSCSYIKEHVSMCESCCSGCKFNKRAVGANQTKFKVNKYVIEALKTNKASLRHYKAYLIMSRHHLFGQAFDPEEYKLDQRTIREFAKYTGSKREITNGQVVIELAYEDKDYLFPNEFIDKGTYEALGERLKPYLVIYTSFVYKANEKYGMMHVKVKKISSILEHKSVESTYAMLREFVRNGMMVVKKGLLFATYFDSYKVVSLEEFKEKKKTKKYMPIYKVEYEYELLASGDQQIKFKIELKSARGSP